MNWDDLLKFIAELTPEQRKTNVTIQNQSNMEFFPALDFCVTTSNDVLDANHPYITY